MPGVFLFIVTVDAGNDFIVTLRLRGVGVTSFTLFVRGLREQLKVFAVCAFQGPGDVSVSQREGRVVGLHPHLQCHALLKVDHRVVLGLLQRDYI